jgi:hypothetical protein
MIMLSLLPLLAGVGGLALLGLAWWNVGEQPEDVRLALVAAGVLLALTGGFITWHNVDWLNNRYVFRFTCNAIGARPDAWVAPEDPKATYVAVTPRKNWGPLLWVTDRGFLLINQARGSLLFEGIQERYRIPASAICSCEIEAMISGGSLYAVVVRCLRKEGGLTEEWEIPLSVAWRGWGTSRASTRLARATELHERIERLRRCA